MKKLLYIAGEPGSGKTTHVAKPLKRKGLGVILHTDKISRRASHHYRGDENFPNKWILWREEFDHAENYSILFAAFSRSMEEREGRPLKSVENIICEGFLSGHPQFRKIMTEILEGQGFMPQKIAQLAIEPPWDQLERNFRTRGRKKDQDREFIEARSLEYKQRTRQQEDLPRFATSEECLNVARDFLESTIA